jgi:gliding motility-associated-like protein
VASPVLDITYTLLVTDSSNCKARAEVAIRVIPDYTLFIPNAVTPNNDGVNDFFEVYGNKSTWREMSITIFNRWGEKVFESNDMDFKWDCTYRSQLQTSQVFTYLFKLTYTNGYLMPLRKGSFTLIR